MRFNNTVLLFLFFVSLLYPALAQQGRLSLKDVLKKVEEHHNVSFTYLDETVDGIYLEDLPFTEGLDETLLLLRQRTLLQFTRLDQRFIAVSRPLPPSIVLCGVLIDKESREKISGATVQYRNSFTVSDAYGRFQIEGPNDSGIVSIKSLGYDSLLLTTEALSTTPCATIELSLHTSILSEIIINNYLTTGIQKLAEGSIIIQTKALGILPGLTEPDVLFSIQALPGIQSVDETVSNINVRGGTHDQNLVLWDGMKMYQQGHFFGLISAFNPYFTKEVNLIKNGTSALLSDGVSSTLDIRSDDEICHELTGGVGLSMLNADVHLKMPLSAKASFHLATRRSIAELLETPTYQSYYDRAFRGTEVGLSTNANPLSTGEDFQFYDISAKLLYDISPRDKLRVNFLQFSNNISYEETEMVNNQTESKVSSLGQQSMAAGVSYSKQWNSRVRSSGQVYLSSYDLGAVNHNILQNQRLVQDNEVLDLGIKIDTRVIVSNLLDIFSGYQFYEVGISNLEDINNPNFYRFKKTVLHAHTLFSEANYTSPSSATALRMGLRANLFSELHRVRIEPRFSIHQKISDYFSLELQGEMKSQTTTQVIDFQNDFLGVEKRKWVMANTLDIPVITSQQLSAGLNFTRRNFLVVLEGYGKWVEDIVTSSQGFQNQFQYVRAAGSYKTVGLDFLINRRIRSVNSWISYSLGKSTFTFHDLIPSSFPNNLDIRHRATVGISYESKHLDLSTGLNWHTGKPYTEPSTNSLENGRIQYQNPNTSRLPTYWRVDFSVNYIFLLSDKTKAMAGISVWNVLNHDNVIDTYYQAGSAYDILQFNRSALGFTPNAIIRLEVSF